MPEQQVADQEVNDDQFVAAGDENWRDEHPELMKDEASRNILSQFDSREDALVGLIEAHKKVSSGFRLPVNLTEAELVEAEERVAKAKGYPEKPEGYLMSDPPDEILPPGMKIDDETKAAFREFCHKRKYPEKDVQEIYEFQKAFVKKMVAAHQTMLAERQEATKEILLPLWGGEKGVATKLEYLKRHLRKYAQTQDEWDDFKGRVFANGIGDEHIILRALGPWAESQEAEGGSPHGGGPGAPQVSDLQRRQAYAKEKWPNSPSMWPKE